MSATVRIPTILRTYTGGVGEVTADGSTLAEVLDSLEGNHPGIRARILDDSGALRRFVNVYVGDDDVRFIGGLDAQVAEGTKISIIPAVAGGAERRALTSGAWTSSVSSLLKIAAAATSARPRNCARDARPVIGCGSSFRRSPGWAAVPWPRRTRSAI